MQNFNESNQYSSYYPAFLITIILITVAFYFTWRVKSQNAALTSEEGQFDMEQGDPFAGTGIPESFKSGRSGFTRPAYRGNQNAPFTVFKAPGQKKAEENEEIVVPPQPEKIPEELRLEERARNMPVSEVDKEIGELVGFETDTLEDLIQKYGRRVVEETYRKARQKKEPGFFGEDDTEAEETSQEEFTGEIEPIQ